MSYSIVSSKLFVRQVKDLAKKYPSIKEDMSRLRSSLESSGVSKQYSLGNNCYKLRLRIASKNQGKSGGARVIVFVRKSLICFLAIYDKSEIEDIPIREIKKVLGDFLEELTRYN